MKQVMKKTSAVLLAVVMMMALVACGGGDTKETVQKTVDDLQAKLTEAMSGYQNVFQNQGGLSDPTQAAEVIDKAGQMIEDAISACDAVEAPGEDSQKYRDAVKGILEVLKSMMDELKGVDFTDSSAAMGVASKYLSDMMSKSTDAQNLINDLVKKYGITAPTNTTTAQ